MDPEFTKDTLKKEPEYLHEAMQRLIINFLAENINNPFMDLERMDKWREQESPSMVAGTTTPQSSDSPRTEPHRPVKRSAQEMENDGRFDDAVDQMPATKIPRKE